MERTIEELFDEVRLVWHTITRRAEELHTGELPAIPMRAILEYLERHGPSTVPTIARSRRVTRQHIQANVNDLLEMNLVDTVRNPAHKRSRFITLTDEGRATIRRILDRERKLLSSLEGVSPYELEIATRALRALRSDLDA